jgi:hypothetical protein
LKQRAQPLRLGQGPWLRLEWNRQFRDAQRKVSIERHELPPGDDLPLEQQVDRLVYCPIEDEHLVLFRRKKFAHREFRLADTDAKTGAYGVQWICVIKDRGGRGRALRRFAMKLAEADDSRTRWRGRLLA